MYLKTRCMNVVISIHPFSKSKNINNIEYYNINIKILKSETHKCHFSILL